VIVEMSRVLVVGPKRHLAAVLETVQGVGSLHVDRIEAEEAPEAFSSVNPESAERAQVETLERLRARVDGLLTLLPAAPVEPAPATDELAAKSLEELEAELVALEEQVQPLVRQRLERRDELELIRSYESAVRVLSPLLGALAGSHSLETVGFILRTRDLSIVADFRRRLVELTGGRIEVVSRVVEEGKVGVVAAFHRLDADAVHGFLARAGVSELRLPSVFADLPPAEAIRRMEERRAALPSEIEGIGAALQRIAQAQRSHLVALRAVVVDRLTRLQVMPQLAQSRYTFVVHGWSPTRMVAAVRRAVQRRFGNEVVIYDTPADPHEAERVPVLLDNPAGIRPFQMLLSLFPPPRYGTWDPSPLIAVTFPLFVGLVIGDVGYGLLFFLCGWWLRNRARAGRPWTVPVLDARLTPRMETEVSWLIRVMAVWVIGFGVIYGEFFGNLPELFFRYHPIFDRVTSPTNQTLYFYAIILTGIAMVYLGLIAHLVMGHGLPGADRAPGHGHSPPAHGGRVREPGHDPHPVGGPHLPGDLRADSTGGAGPLEPLLRPGGRGRGRGVTQAHEPDVVSGIVHRAGPRALPRPAPGLRHRRRGAGPGRQPAGRDGGAIRRDWGVHHRGPDCRDRPGDVLRLHHHRAHHSARPSPLGRVFDESEVSRRNRT